MAGICGALLTNLTASLSGTRFDLELVGGAFKTIAYFLPFVHAVDIGKAALAGTYTPFFPDLRWILGYGISFVTIAVLVFKRKCS